MAGVIHAMEKNQAGLRGLRKTSRARWKLNLDPQFDFCLLQTHLIIISFSGLPLKLANSSINTYYKYVFMLLILL